MKTGAVYLRLDGRWGFDDLGTMSKLYIQCYALVYSLSGFQLESTDENVYDYFKGEFARYPWRGGYSTVNFYRRLYSRIPAQDVPEIEEIQYASPGHIKLKEALKVAGILSGIVAAIVTSLNQLNELYVSVQKGLSDRELTKIDISEREFALKQKDLDYVIRCKEELIKEMNIPSVMREELVRRCASNELMQLKILSSFYRRVQPIAEFELQGMVYLENPVGHEPNKVIQPTGPASGGADG